VAHVSVRDVGGQNAAADVPVQVTVSPGPSAPPGPSNAGTPPSTPAEPQSQRDAAGLDLLAFTGFALQWYVAVGLGLLALGALGTALGRRRRGVIVRAQLAGRS
jgi:hypothetical protein